MAIISSFDWKTDVCEKVWDTDNSTWELLRKKKKFPRNFYIVILWIVRNVTEMDQNLKLLGK